MSGSQGVYRQEGDGWLALGTASAGKILGQDEIGRVWVLLDGALYEYGGGGQQEIAALPAQYVDLAVDGEGRLWVARLSTPEGQLWWLDPLPIEENL